MTTDNKIHFENITGEFFVNDQCIICDMCFQLAPATFRLSSDGSQSVAYRQPETDEEARQAEAACSACPVEAIERNN